MSTTTNLTVESESIGSIEEINIGEGSSTLPAKDPLADIRDLMENTNVITDKIQAYIIPNHDAHMSEYLAETDKRLLFVTGFSGSAGTAIITAKHACMWTDPRYFIQAGSELSEEWTLMKMGIPGTLNESEWLTTYLPRESIVGADPKLTPYPIWTSLTQELEKQNIKLVSIVPNLVDFVWSIKKPPPPQGMMFHVPEKHSGMLSSDKVEEVRIKMKAKSVDMLVVTALDDIAWLLNLRGSDINYNPVFFAFLILTKRKIHLFIDDKKITLTVRNHFNKENSPVSLHPYDNVYTFVKQMVESEALGINKVWLPTSTNYYIYDSIPAEKRFCECSPIAVMKAVKNEVEAEGMINAHIKDGVALCQYFHWLEKEIQLGVLTEIDAANKLEKYRQLEELYVGPSFQTISASGPHAAITHYTPDENSNRLLSVDEVYLCDSGAQFQDGTTDVTRTFHFGTPTEFQIEAYTRVFKGLASLTTAIFPSKVKGNTLDSFARKALWDVGLDYGHGTGHGIGSYLYVHEGPMGISWRPYPDDPGLQENMFLSNEPGFYSEEEFGIRIENIVQIITATTPFNHKERGFLTFNTVTMCPIQTKMLNFSILSEAEVHFLNEYHAEVLENLGPLIKKRGLMDVYDWLVKQTAAVEVPEKLAAPSAAPVTTTT